MSELFIKLCGLSSFITTGNTVKKYFRYFIKALASLKHMTEYDLVDISYDSWRSHIKRSTYKDNPFTAYSWEDIYYIAQALQKCYRYSESIESKRIITDYPDEEREVGSKCLNRNAEDKFHYDIMRRFIISSLVTFPEMKRIKVEPDDGRVHFEEDKTVRNDDRKL